VVVNIVNRHEKNPIIADIVLQSGDFTGSAKVHEINGETINSANTKTKEEVKIVTKDIKFKGSSIRYSFPAHSVTQIHIPFR
jgi:alpha-N-arabinofuranosidase